MTRLGLNETVPEHSGDLGAEAMMHRFLGGAERAGGSWLRHLIFPSVLGTSFAVVAELFRLMQADPHGALALLQQWGPNFFIGLVITIILGGLLSQVVDISRDGVGAQRQMAEAITKIAEKDDRQIQEIQTLQSYTATQMMRMHERQTHAHRMLQMIATKLNIPAEELKRSEEDHYDRADS